MSHSHSASQQQKSDCCGHCHSKDKSERNKLKVYAPAILSLMMLLIGILLDHVVLAKIFNGNIKLIWYILAYIPVGLPVLREAFETIKAKDLFNEFTLMSIATIGAFCIGDYAEGVAVMLFYSVGELFQDSAVSNAKKNIKSLLDIRPDSATVLRNNQYEKVYPENVKVGEVILVKVGEKVPLDGLLISTKSSFNTSALTGESKPTTIQKGETVLAGMLNLAQVVEIQVSKKYTDSSLSKILDMVQNATERKSKTELFIRKFARIYTPIVFGLAILITILPFFFVTNYQFADWLYRALVFLVISCPCALVISIPLGYFGGIGAASRQGILFKGASYLDTMCKVNMVVMDKTGTLTQGVFEVQKVHTESINTQEFVEIVAAVEKNSTHPIAKAVVNYAGAIDNKHQITQVTELAGYGLSAIVDDREVLIGNTKLLKKNDIEYDLSVDDIVESILVVAIDKAYVGYIVISDKEKNDASEAVQAMYRAGIEETIMLSGDKDSITQQVKDRLRIKHAYGDLLPEDKVKYVEELKSKSRNIVAFVGDGINDAPALALSDVGIAMGGMGSDAAIEVADVIIQTDQPIKIAQAIKIARSTRNIVLQNIVLAFIVKIFVLILGAYGLISMWVAVFADVGVALLAILNSIRIMKKKF